MKKSEILYTIAMVALVLGIISVIVFKFVLQQKPRESFSIKNPDQINITDLNGNSLKLVDYMGKDNVSYLLIFQLNDCFSCVLRGMNDLKELQQAGRQCLGLAVHDYPQEVSGWSAHQDFSPFLMMKRLDFFEHVQCAHTPVFVKMVNGKIESYRYILAN
jgi:hypothetical protein